MGWSKAAETLREQEASDWADRCHATVQDRQCKRTARFRIAVEGTHESSHDRACWQHVARLQDRRVARVMNTRRVTVEEVER